MVRRLKAVQPKKDTGEINFEDFVSETPTPTAKRGRPKPLSLTAFKRVLLLTNELKDAKAWNEFEPKNFVALYCMLHGNVYGVIPEEVRDVFTLVVNAAKKQLKDEFSGDNKRMVEFMRWVWAREKKRNATRSEDNDFRIGWRLQFGRTLLSDYRVARARKGRKVQ